MRKRFVLLMLCAAAFIVLLGSPKAFADGISLALIPASGDVVGPPGSTVGWGYTITNSTSDWLVTMNLSADVFQHGTPDSFFDFPVVAPSAMVTVNFVPNSAGLFQFTWDSTAPVGFVNRGTFIISSDFFNGDPPRGGTDIGPAPDLTASYTATASPEPSTVLLLLGGVLGLGLLKRKSLRR